MDSSYLTNAEQEDDDLIVPEIKQVYGRLHTAIEEMEKKVGHVIKINESQFLLAYRNHIKKIKKQLFEIKQKSEEQEKMFTANDRIKYLEKELTVFRDESAKSFQSFEKKFKQLDEYRKKYEELMEMYATLENANKELIRQNKIAETKRISMENKVQELCKQIERKNEEIENLKMKESIKSTKNMDSIQEKLNLASLRSSKFQNVQKAKKTHRYSDWNIESQFKEFFFDCVRTVKKQIKYRKGNMSHNIGHISNIEEFRAVDKWRIIELFFQNPQLQEWMYEKLFPNNLMKKMGRLNENEKNVSLPRVRDLRAYSNLDVHENKTFL